MRQKKKGQQPPAGIGTAISVKRRPGTSEGPRPGSGPGSFGSLPGPDWGPEPEPLPPPDMSAFDWMRQMLRTYGLDSLAGNIEDWIRDGITDAAELELRLQQTDEWKIRFAGNEELRRAGLPVLSVSEYLSVERAYAQVMKNYGLPTGFFDDPSDFAGFIGKSVSPSELQTRVQMYSDVAKREDPAVISQLQALGLSEGDILSYFVDAERAMPILQRKYQQTLIGAASRRAGVATDNDYLGHLADIGVTEQEAITGFGATRELADTYGQLGSIHGESYTAADASREVFESDATAKKKRKRLASRERAAWSGEAGTDAASFQRLTGGAY